MQDGVQPRGQRLDDVARHARSREDAAPRIAFKPVILSTMAVASGKPALRVFEPKPRARSLPPQTCGTAVVMVHSLCPPAPTSGRLRRCPCRAHAVCRRPRCWTAATTTRAPRGRPPRGIAQSAGLGLGGSDDLCQVVQRAVGASDQHVGQIGQMANGREVFFVRRRAGGCRGADSCSRQRLWSGLACCHRRRLGGVGGTDDAGSARFVVQNDWHAKPAGQLLGDSARQHVDRKSGREGATRRLGFCGQRPWPAAGTVRASAAMASAVRRESSAAVACAS